MDDLGEFEQIMNANPPEHREITQRSGLDQVWAAIAGLIVTATICGGLTWVSWWIPATVRWWAQ